MVPGLMEIVPIWPEKTAHTVAAMAWGIKANPPLPQSGLESVADWLGLRKLGIRELMNWLRALRRSRRSKACCFSAELRRLASRARGALSIGFERMGVSLSVCLGVRRRRTW